MTDGHLFPLCVYYEDTDAGGVVYYASYLRFAERARTEWLRSLGVDHATLRARDGVMLAVRSCAAEFVRPGRLDDRLEVRTRLLGVSGASLRVSQVVRRGRDVLAELKLRLVCVRPDGRPARLPARLRLAAGSMDR